MKISAANIATKSCPTLPIVEVEKDKMKNSKARQNTAVMIAVISQSFE